MSNVILPLVTGLFLWFKADAITGITSGQPVARWIDSSSSKSDATATDPRLQPTFQANVLNGKPTLRFRGGQRLSTLPLQLFQAGGDSLTMLIVFQTNTIDRPSCLINKSNLVPPERLELVIDAGSQASGNIGLEQVDKNAVTSAPNIISPANFYIFSLSLGSDGNTPDNVSMAIDSSPLELFKYGNGWLDSGNYPTHSSPFEIGGRNDQVKNRSSQDFFRGDIAEILAFSHQLSPRELGQVGCYLRVKYNIIAAAPWCSMKESSY